MFSQINKTTRNAIYGVLCQTNLPGNQTNFGNGTAFMIAPGICLTAAHVLHVEGDKTKPIHSRIEVIRAPEIGVMMSQAQLIAEDKDQDMALIRIINPTGEQCLSLHSERLDPGTSCGSLGFPLASAITIDQKIAFNLTERFQGAYLSAFQSVQQPEGFIREFYETDSLMYGGSSGCPGYTVDGKVFGMHVATVTDGKDNQNSSRLAISLWVPSWVLIRFVQAHGFQIS